MKLNLMDIIALTKSGYKKKDIDEMLKSELPEDPEEPEETESPEEAPEHEESEEEEQPSNDLLKENKKLKAQIAELQKSNRNADHASGTDEAAERSKRIANRVKDFM